MGDTLLAPKRLDGLDLEGTKVLTIDCDATVLEAAGKMRHHNVGCLVATGAKGKPVGIITEHDLVHKVIAAALPPQTTAVRAVMSGELVFASPQASLNEAREIMARHRIRHLPIIDKESLVGIASSRDILAHQFAAIKAVLSQHDHVLKRLRDECPGLV